MAYDAELAATISALRAMKDRAEKAEAALRTIRDSTFRNAMQLRAIADCALSGSAIRFDPTPTPEGGG
jgi:hypothetical protein